MVMETPRRPRLLGQMPERFRAKHFSLCTEQAYVHRIRRMIVFHDSHGPRGRYPQNSKLRRKL